MLKRTLCILAASALLLSFVSCTKTQKEATPQSEVTHDIAEDIYTFTDARRNFIEINGRPKRAAILFSSFAEIWTLAGGDVAITVGESVERSFADESAVLVDDGAGKAINTELLIAAEPDIVICSADIEAQLDAAALLDAAGIPTAALRVESFDDYLYILRLFTDILGTPDAYEKYGTRQAETITSLLSSLPKDQPQKRILFIRSGSGASSAKAKTASEHFAAAMLDELGAYNIADNAPILLDGLSVEEIIKEDPDIIFISTMGDEVAAKAYMDSLLQSEAWRELTAVKSGNCHYLPKELFQYKPNARWCEAYIYLASLLYPGLNMK